MNTAVAPSPATFVLGEGRLFGANRPPLTYRDRTWLITASRGVGLLGRGGAAFPVAAKLEVTPRHASVVVNGTEGEPASWKDRALMRSSPGLVIDGALVVAHALKARRVLMAIADPGARAAIRAAASARPDARDIEIMSTEHDFVGGEVNALLNGLSGRPVAPNGRRTLPTERGLNDKPTFASNVETFAQIAVLAGLGPDEYARVGSVAEGGTTLVTAVGDVPHPGVLEAPAGTPLRHVIGDVASPVLIGGYHGNWTSPDDLRIDRPGLRARGLSWGAGVVAVLPDDTCPIGEIARVAEWLAHESIGQCGPCLFGLGAIADDLGRLASGQPLDFDRLQRRLGLVEGRGACRHPDGATRFVGTGLVAYADDVARHRAGGCDRPVRGILPIGAGRTVKPVRAVVPA